MGSLIPQTVDVAPGARPLGVRPRRPKVPPPAVPRRAGRPGVPLRRVQTPQAEGGGPPLGL